jgi:hypothetical protein
MELVKCEICKEVIHKYKCPACAVKTCSLKCCKTHKELYSCNGQRDKTKFVKLNEFSERELMNDYNFLEEQSRLVDNTQRDVLKRKYDITHSMEYLKNLAYRQSKIVLQYMPRHSTKRLANRTRYDNVTKIISWHIDFKFFDIVYTLNELCSSKESVGNILSKFYKEHEFTLFLIGQPLHEYQSGFENDDLNVLYEIRNFTLKCKYFIKFDLKRSLEECFHRKTIIEYPVLNIVLNNDVSKFNVKNEEEIIQEMKNIHIGENYEKEEGECDEDEGQDEENKCKKSKIEEEEDEIDEDDINIEELELEFEKLERGLSEAGINFEKI